MNRNITISVRVPLELVDEIETMVKSRDNPMGRFTSANHTIRECTILGLQVLKHADAMKDPAKNAEFIAKMERMIKTENYSQFTEALDTTQLEGFIMLLKLEKEKRYEQGVLR